MVYLNDNPDRAPRLNGTDLSHLAGPDDAPALTRIERVGIGLLFGYLAAGAVALLGCGIAGVVWAWLHLPH